MVPIYKILFIVLCINFNLVQSLLFPRFSVLQITSAFSVPVEVPKRKLYFDWGFQMNYDLPFNTSNFYNIPIWPGFKDKRSLDNNLLENPHTKYNDRTNSSITSALHPSDLTAGEFYSAIEDLLFHYGYHDSCLLKSVCELAQHPFDLNGRENVITEVISFILSPSIHDGFGENEFEYQQLYENAEINGFSGKNCDKLYPDCKRSFLKLISKVKFLNIT